MACSTNRSGDGGPPGPPPPGPMRPSRPPGPARPSRGPPGPWPSRTPPGRSNEPPRSGGPSGRSGGWATETVTSEAAITAMAVSLAIPGIRLITDSLERGGLGSHADVSRHLQRPLPPQVAVGSSRALFLPGDRPRLQIKGDNAALAEECKSLAVGRACAAPARTTSRCHSRYSFDQVLKRSPRFTRAASSRITSGVRRMTRVVP